MGCVVFRESETMPTLMVNTSILLRVRVMDLLRILRGNGSSIH